MYVKRAHMRLVGVRTKMGNCVFCGVETNYILYEGKYVCKACVDELDEINQAVIFMTRSDKY
jgi:hypothetical protein